MPLYDGPVIDAHHHLWDYAMGCHPWLKPDGGAGGLSKMELLRRDYLAGEYLADMAAENIVATVHIEALWDAADPLGETRWLDRIERPAALPGLAQVCIGAAPLASAEGPAVIEAQAAFPRLRGLRSVLSHHPEPGRSFVDDPDLASRPAYRDSLAVIADLGLSLDVMAFPWQTGHLDRLARDFPGLQIVLNHCGSPVDQDAAGLARWHGMLARLGERPNVAVKLANAGLYGTGTPQERALRDVTACLDAFGPGRCLFGTDLPVSLRHRPAATSVELIRSATAGLPAADQAEIFEGAARRIYRL